MRLKDLRAYLQSILVSMRKYNGVAFVSAFLTSATPEALMLLDRGARLNSRADPPKRQKHSETPPCQGCYGPIRLFRARGKWLHPVSSTRRGAETSRSTPLAHNLRSPIPYIWRRSAFSGAAKTSTKLLTDKNEIDMRPSRR